MKLNKRPLYFKVLGYPTLTSEPIILGYTSNIKAWLSEPNGWLFCQLHFIPMIKK